jgi:hypothetical protein
MAAGYGIVSLVKAPKSRLMLASLGCALFIFPTIVGTASAQWSFQGWNNASAVVTAFNKVSGDLQGQIAIENSSDAALRYYTSAGRNWSIWAEKWTGISLPKTAGHISAAKRAALIKEY